MKTQRKHHLSWILLVLICLCAAYVLYLAFTTFFPKQARLLTIPAPEMKTEIQGFSGSVLTAYVDYSCEYCRAFYKTTYPALKKEYVDTGKVKFEFKDYPNGVLHKEAYTLHQMPYCAKEQGKYTEMVDLLLTSENPPTVASVKAELSQLGLRDEKAFLDCVDTRKYDYLLQAYRNEAKALGFTATPSFVIGDRKIYGNQNLDFIKKELDTYLDQRIPSTKL